MKNFEELTLKDNFMFGIVMRDEKLCKKALEIILQKKISKISIPEDEKVINTDPRTKGIRLDVYCEGEDTVYDIEMQNIEYDDLSKRIRYYQSMMDMRLLNKGNDYDDLKKNIIIFICSFDYFKMNRHIYTFENICIQDTDISLGDETQKIILNTKGTMDDVNEDLKNFLTYIEKGIISDKYTAELDDTVSTTRNSEKWKVSYMTLEMYVKDRIREASKEIIAEGIAEGKAEGLAEGKAEGLAEALDNLLNNTEMTLEEAMSALGFSEDMKKQFRDKYNTNN